MKSKELLDKSSLAEKSIIKARAQLILDEPFFGSLALKLKLQEDPLCKSAWTDGESFGYNPDYINNCSIQEIKTLISKQVLAVSLGHPWRLEQREQKHWQKASDISCLFLLKKYGFVIPSEIVLDTSFETLPAEKIYGMLREDEKEESSKAPSEGASSSSEKSENKDKAEGGEKNSGSFSFGELKAPISKEKEQEMQESWEVSIAQAQSHGEAPSMVSKKIGNKSYSKDTLFGVLSTFLESSAQGLSDYDENVPDELYLLNDLFVPSLCGKSIKGLAIVRDSSGSISKSHLEMFNSAILDLVDSYKIDNLWVIDCDCEIKRVLKNEEISQESLSSIKGGGGTSFKPPFEYLQNSGEEVSCLIYLTDLMGAFPSENSIPCLWTVPENWMYNKKPPFGECISISV